MTGRTLRDILLFILPFLVLIIAPGGALAHAVVTGSEPSDGVILADAPENVTIRFNEPVSLVRTQILDPEGQDVLVAGSTSSDDGHLRLGLPASLVEGTYTVSYYLMSIDGHPIAGSLIFSVGRISGDVSEESAARRSGTQTANEPTLWLFAFLAIRVALYLGVFGAAGGVAFLLLVMSSGRSRHSVLRIITASSITGFVAALVGLGLQGGMLLGNPPGFLLDGETWLIGARSPFGRTAIAAIFGFALIWIAARIARSATAHIISVIGSLLVLASFAFSGHVITGGPFELTVPPLLLHVAIAAFWVGSLLPLLRVLTRPEASLSVSRFSHVAVMAVPVMVLAGAVLAALQVREPNALLTTEYGLILIGKLVLVAALLGLAVLNRAKLTPALTRGDEGASRRLGRSIQAEIGTVVAILFATAALGTTTPPRALLLGRDEAVLFSGRSVDAIVSLQPGRIGLNEVNIVVQDSDGRPQDVEEVAVWFSNSERGVAPLVRPAKQMQPGRWKVPELVLALPGAWQVEVDILISDFAGETLEGRFAVQEVIAN